jgi:hypothetical protein
LLGLFFHPKDGGDIFLRNLGWSSTSTRRYMLEERTLNNHRCDNLKSRISEVGLSSSKYREV